MNSGETNSQGEQVRINSLEVAAKYALERMEDHERGNAVSLGYDCGMSLRRKPYQSRNVLSLRLCSDTQIASILAVLNCGTRLIWIVVSGCDRSNVASLCRQERTNGSLSTSCDWEWLCSSNSGAHYRWLNTNG